MLIFFQFEFPNIRLNLFDRAIFPFILIFKSQSRCFLGEVENTSSALLTFREILFAFNQFAKIFRP